MPAADGQQPAPQPAAQPAATEAARKAEILASECWRRAIFERNEWLRTQTVFPPEEVARIKTDFAARVDQMSAKELEFLLADLQAKFRLLETPEARDIRAWFGNYLSILAERRREEVLRDIPDLATMNSTQLQQTLARLAERRDARARPARVMPSANPWASSAPARRPATSSGYRSPYRPRSFERPFDNVQTGQTRNRMIDPMGGVWLSF
jgi:hypothetical protein